MVFSCSQALSCFSNLTQPSLTTKLLIGFLSLCNSNSFSNNFRYLKVSFVMCILKHTAQVHCDSQLAIRMGNKEHNVNVLRFTCHSDLKSAHVHFTRDYYLMTCSYTHDLWCQSSPSSTRHEHVIYNCKDKSVPTAHSLTLSPLQQTFFYGCTRALTTS